MSLNKQVTTMTKLKLPDPIAAYFEADKRDAEALVQFFTGQATVKDEGRIHSGTAAIKAWKTEVSAKYKYTSEPFGIEQKDGDYVVTSRLTGHFPGSPVDLRYTFRFEGNKIAFLEIAP